MRLRYIILSFLLFLSISSFAQKGMIKGMIYNVKTNQPIEFASILIQGTAIGSTSDLDGNYIFTGVEPGFKHLVVSSIGFITTVSAEFQVQGNQTTFIDVAIEESAVQLGEVTVRRNFTAKKIESPLSVLS